MRLSFLLSLTLVGTSWAQNGLTDIPDTSIKAQLESFKLPEGAVANLFASEPLIKKPTHMNWDSQGRLWVVGSPLYPHIKPGEEESDQVVILEDTTGDGVADKHTVFADDLHIPTAVLPGDGGAYIANSSDILFLKDTDGDGKADHREVVLSGFGTEDTHHLVHTFRWGPEGMMWLNQSIYIHTHLETPYGVRRLLGGGMWHFRPETRRAEVFMKGLVNPWGHAFDEWGQSFLTDGAGSNGINFGFPRSVFVSSPGAARVVQGLNPGQPKHCGLEILSGSHLPEAWQGAMLAPDFRGHRINAFRLTDKDSAYVSSQGEDFIASTHRAFRPIDVKMGPDGAVYVADFYNPIIQHGEVDFRDPRRDHEHGRIWRISFPANEPAPFAKPADMTAAELVNAVVFSDEGIQRELATAELRVRDADAILAELDALTVDSDLHRLRKIWATQAVNRFDVAAAKDLAMNGSADAKAKAGALRALYYDAGQTEGLLEIAEAAVADKNAQVRLWGVSLLAQLDAPDTVAIALRALDGGAADDFLDFAIWSICREHQDHWVPQMESDGGENPFASQAHLLFAARAVGRPLGADRILTALRAGEISSDEEVKQLADWVATVGGPQHNAQLFEHALAAESPAQQQSLLNALLNAANLRKVKPAGDLGRVTSFLKSENAGIFTTATKLAGAWQVDSIRPELEAIFVSDTESPQRVDAALNGLIALGGEPTAHFFAKLNADPSASYERKVLAVKGLMKANPGAAAAQAVALLQSSPEGEDGSTLFSAFLSNKGAVKALAKSLEGKTLPEPVALAGLQLANSSATRPEGLISALQTAGSIQQMKMALSTEEMEAMIARVANEGDPHRGEEIYRRTALQCIVCHAIGGAGGVIGPDMVSIGSSAPVDYLVESLLEPSKKIKEGYHTNLVTLKNGDSFAGGVDSETDSEIVIRDMAGSLNRIAKAEIENQTISPVSLMPMGLTGQLREDEFVDLVRFLSELGKEGDFKTSPKRYLRQWQTLMPHDKTRDEIGHYGRKLFAEDFDGYVWLPFYASVGGGLPLSEMPQVVGRQADRFGVARTYVEITAAGNYDFNVSGNLKGLSLFCNDKEIELAETVTISFPEPGRYKFTVSGLHGGSLDDIGIEALADASVLTFVKIADF